MTHSEFLKIDGALCDRLYCMPFLPTSPTAVERECLHAIRYAVRDFYLYQAGSIYAAELYGEVV